MTEKFTLLRVKAGERRTDHLATYHNVVIDFAKKSSIQFHKETLEVKSQDIKSVHIQFVVGDDMAIFVESLKNLAEYLQKDML